ncbi:histidine protein methyltransferase 1 homolog [Asterias amurensis]|uniref:histidine protein methyltransferase 1 homolog n=1 Tax=Asterias amurensis TaxID=7602 RepID=UPI003AB808F2
MSFQFNFDVSVDEEQHLSGEDSKGNSENASLPTDSTNNSTEALREAKELFTPTDLTAYESCAVDVVKVGDLELCFLNPDDVESELIISSFSQDLKSEEDESDVSKAVDGHSDLIPKVYEGGLKVWECSLDLVHFLHDAEIPVKNKRVLELGCGIGLPGIYAVKKEAAAVHFQDYNEEVIEHMTIPSVILNKPEEDSTNQDLRYLSGDWSLVQKLLSSEDQSTKYDVILTSETIYSLESYDKLYHILRAVLRPTGVIYLAAKTHYFGVGGGTRSFEDMVKQRGEFSIEVCKTYTQGVKREILKMSFLEAPKD